MAKRYRCGRCLAGSEWIGTKPLRCLRCHAYSEFLIEVTNGDQHELFDAVESNRLKQLGMKRSASARRKLLGHARTVALDLATIHGTCTSDMVNRYALETWNMDLAELLGPAMGSLFKGPRWAFTGDRVKSTRVKNHAREIKVWRLNR